MAYQAKDKEIFENYPISKAIAVMAVPTIVSQLIHVVYNLSDTWFVGLSKDPNAVAAISLILPIYNLMTGFANLFGIGGAAVVARSLGYGDKDKAKRAFSSAIWAAIIVAIVYSVFIGIFGRRILLLIGADSSNIMYAYRYSIISIVIGAIPTIVSAAIASLIRSTGASKVASIGLTTGAISNIILDPLFMFVLLPRGNEVIGAAIATTLSNIISLVYFVIYLYRHRDYEIYNANIAYLKGSSVIVKETVRCGLPSFLILGMAMFSNCFLNNITSSYGSSYAIAGLGVTRKIDSLGYSFINGVTQGVLPIMSYCYAAKRFDRMKKTILYSIIIVLTFSLTNLLVCTLAAPSLIGFFIDNPQTIVYGAKYLRILSVSIPIYSVTFVIIAVLQSVGRSRPAMALTLIRKGTLDVICFYIIKNLWGAGEILYASPIVECVAVTTALIMLFILLNKIKIWEVKNEIS